MPIFKLSAPETVRLSSGHILPRSESNFTHNHLDFQKRFPGQKPPDPCLQDQKREMEGWEGIKGFIPSKGSAEGKDRGGAIRAGREKDVRASGRGS